MIFELDKQTIQDLDIFGDGKSGNSIFNFYNQTRTIGGRDALSQLMENPLNDLEELNKRVEIISFLASIRFELKINSAQFEFIEHYIGLNIPTLRNNIIDSFLQNLSDQLKPKNDYYLIQTGILQIKYLFIHLKEKLALLEKHNLPESLNEQIKVIRKFIENDDLGDFNKKGDKISFSSLNRLDSMLRNKHKNELQECIKSIYNLDALISVSKVANRKQLAFPKYIECVKPYISLEKLYHPLLSNAIPYDIEIRESNNLCFVTGSNMAGKSTFLKAVGLAVYIAHLGFPVPASKMHTSIYNGIVTTINLSDSLSKGFSHFYGEVRRVKETALKLKEKRRLFVIFDELFRGTNVKDAFDASLLIIASFAKINISTFFISTHITEVAEKLEKLTNIQFKYFDSKMIDNKPVFEYKLKDGVSQERLGMYIVINEGIVEILNSISD